MTSQTGGRRRLPAQSGPLLTDRDVDILRWISRHGVVTPAQVTRKFFSSQWAAYRRLRVLESLKLIRDDRTFWREPNVIRVTTKGAAVAETGLKPAKLVLAQLKHTFAVVDLTEALLANSAKGTEYLTERELGRKRRHEIADGKRQLGRGRCPDAEFSKANGQIIAIEIDTSPKRSKDYERILTAYLQERYDRVLWYVGPRQVERVAEVVRRQRADDVVEVRAWRGPEHVGKV